MLGFVCDVYANARHGLATGGGHFSPERNLESSFSQVVHGRQRALGGLTQRPETMCKFNRRAVSGCPYKLPCEDI